jgi:hypothetical protein
MARSLPYPRRPRSPLPSPGAQLRWPSIGRRSGGGPGAAVRRRILLTAAAAVALATGAGAVPAAAAACPEKNPSYTGACGPTFVLPGWGDAGGWTDPEQYETIQLADVDGDGADELLGRTPAGLAIHNFDTTLGQWRPQLDDGDRPIVLTEFGDPPPLSPQNKPGSNGKRWQVGGYPPKTDWTLPQYYDTIQAANIDKDPGEEILARSVDGVMVFKFTPIGARKDGRGSWRHVSTSWQLADRYGWGDGPFYYTTMGTGDLDGDGDAELFARGSAGPTVLDWNGSSWRVVANITEILSDADGGKNPAYFTSLQAANVTGDKREELIARDLNGIAVYLFDPGTWKPTLLNGPLENRPFSDVSGKPDCPFDIRDAAHPCLGSAPAYYGTLQLADIAGDGNHHVVLGRTPGGLRARWFEGGTYQLTDLDDGHGYGYQDKWETIQFADINRDGSAELLARDKDGLNAWSYTGVWTKLAPKTPLALADDPWGTDRSYYSTIQTGDVDGDERDDVIARGPYGIRTWFYDRRGTGGWESYLPYGYAGFDSVAKNKAYARLNQLARENGYLTAAESTIRDVWAATQEPTADLNALIAKLPGDARCTDKLPPVDQRPSPPQYNSCVLPADAKDYTADDWKAVVNEILAELFYADQVMDHFHHRANGVGVVWQKLFLDQLAQMQSITDDLKLRAAANIKAEYDNKELFSGITGIAATVIALIPEVGEFAAAPIEITSEVISMIPSAAESLTDEFDTTLGELETKFAAGVSQANQAMADHSQIIRQDAHLLTLVGELRARGTWALDPTAMVSAGQQGFSLWLYKTLLPKMYVRYEVTNCYQRNLGDSCKQSSMSRARLGEPGVANGVNSPSFTIIGYPPAPPNGSHPCYKMTFNYCDYLALPDDLADKVWREMDPICTYDGTTNAAAWTFGSCDVGVDPLKSIQRSSFATQNWDFTTYPGDFWVCDFCPQGATPITAGSTRAVAGSGAATRLSGTVRGNARVVPGSGAALRLRGTVGVPRSLRLRGASVKLGRLLHERGGAGELVGGRPGLPLTLAPSSTGDGTRAFAGRRRAGRRVHLRLHRRSPRLLAFTLRTSGRRVSVPDACSGTRRGVDIADDLIVLHTRLRIRDARGRSHLVSLPSQWHCRTNRLGTVHKLVVRQPKPLIPSRGGLAVRVRGPRRVTAGRVATYRITVRNRRRTPAYDALIHASLPRGFTAQRHRRARPDGDLVTWRFARLRPGRSKTILVRARIDASAAGARRVAVGARAIDTRSAARRITLRIRGQAGVGRRAR